MARAAEASPAADSRIGLLQLASPALPIGGYSYSTGLESAIDNGQVHDADSTFDWIDDVVTLVVGRFDAPLLVAALGACEKGDSERLAELNLAALAARETAELRLESEQMGYSLSRWTAEVLGGDEIPLDGARPIAAAIAWAAAASRLKLSARDAVTAFLWSFAENQVMVLIKTIPMGQIQAQRVLHRLGPRITAVTEAALVLRPHQWSSAAPGLAIASMTHETQYSRLFRS